MDVKNNESFGAHFLKFFESADSLEQSWFPVPSS